MQPNARKFQMSITQELDVIKNRVRNLIGSKHWGEEGRFKEAILKNIIKKFLPSNLSVGTGFIIGNNENEISAQSDIIIYDNTKPLMFSEGDFIITTLSNVRGMVEVKSRVTTSSFQNVLKNFEASIDMLAPFNEQGSIRRGIFPSEILTLFPSPKPFFGIFAFQFDGKVGSQLIDRALRASKSYINHISLGPEIFIRRWFKEDGQHLNPEIITNVDFYNVYEIEKLSFAYFISNLVDMTSGVPNDRHWFSYPINGTKETQRLRTIHLDRSGI